jgi:hypothetical protein
LRRLFERLQKYQLRLNPIKCSFEVRIGKLLDFVVSSRGIEVNLDKAKAVEDISIHNTKKKNKNLRWAFELHSLVHISADGNVRANFLLA